MLRPWPFRGKWAGGCHKDVKQLTAKVADFDGRECTQETTFSDHKEMEGIKKATRLELKRDGKPIQEHSLTEFHILDTVDPATFAPPYGQLQR